MPSYVLANIQMICKNIVTNAKYRFIQDLYIKRVNIMVG